MIFPNQYCGECTRWQLYGEPDTSEEMNKEIEYYCNNCCEAAMDARGWMTEQEAIKLIKTHMEVHRIGDYPHVKIGVALCIAMGALDKQTPKKPQEANKYDYECPCCHNTIASNDDVWVYDIRPKYCEHCGQCLDWKI